MSKGRLSNGKWFVTSTGWNSYLAERIVNEKYEKWEGSAHCLQCAKAEVLAKFGGIVDLRGSHLSICGSFLRAMQSASEDEEILNVEELE